MTGPRGYTDTYELGKCQFHMVRVDFDAIDKAGAADITLVFTIIIIIILPTPSPD